jgi:hypothetical protein
MWRHCTSSSLWRFFILLDRRGDRRGDDTEGDDRSRDRRGENYVAGGEVVVRDGEGKWGLCVGGEEGGSPPISLFESLSFESSWLRRTCRLYLRLLEIAIVLHLKLVYE